MNLNEEQTSSVQIRAKLILAPLISQNELDPQYTNQYRMFFVQTSTLPSSMHQKLAKHGMCCMQNNQLPTKTHVEVEHNSYEGKTFRVVSICIVRKIAS